MKNTSFKSLLERLSYASKDAVVNGSKAIDDNLKKYLHIERDVENKLSSIVLSASRESTKQLILLVANVGDGKSHLLARLFELYPTEMKDFTVHNDATASYSKSENYITTLERVLSPFSDDNINNGNNEKIIIAINLGTLANFLDETKVDHKVLKKFVSEKNILSESVIGNGIYHKNSHIQYINLTDFNIFELTDTLPKSKVIKKFFQLITNHQLSNPFYKSYVEYYKKNEVWSHKCPIKANYEFISNERNQDIIIQVLIEVIVKNKLIVSIRELLNFFFDILVPSNLYNKSNKEYEDYVKGISSFDYLNSLILNQLYKNPDKSALLNGFYNEDPFLESSFEEDSQILNSFSLNKIEDYKCLNSQFFLECLHHKSLDKSDLMSLLPRMAFFDHSNGTSDIFKKYTKALYDFNNGNKSGIKTVYENIISALKCWNGLSDVSSNKLNVYIGKAQNKYRISADIKLNIDPKNVLKTNDYNESTFDLYLLLFFKDIEDPLKVDFNLFQLFNKINRGYRPNYLDKRSHISVQRFLDDAFHCQNSNELIYFTDLSSIDKKYLMQFDSMGDFVFEEVINE